MWRSYGYVWAPASSYTYGLKHKFPYTGKWRLRVYHAADGYNAATWSSYSYVTVK